MVAAIALFNLLIVFISQPWLANPPAEEIGYTLDPSELEFIDDENESTIPWKDTLLVIKIICLLILAIRQLKSMKVEKDEVEEFLSKCYQDHKEIMEVPKFYEDTEKAMCELERKSKAINKRLQNAEKMIKDYKGCDKIKEDLDFVRESWFQEYSAFSVLDINLNEEYITESELQKQIEVIKKCFDEDILKVENNMEEDMLSLEEVDRDTHTLHNYFNFDNVSPNISDNIKTIGKPNQISLTLEPSTFPKRSKQGKAKTN